jgi:uncharacterized protein
MLVKFGQREFAVAVVSLFVGVFLNGCADYADRIRVPRSLFDSGQYDAAISQLKPLVDRKDNDELLYLMDLGLVYHSAGRYKQAIETFHAAETLATLRDYTSISTEVGTVIFNDDIKPYKGEDFEKIMINVYLAMDYTLAGNFEDALVECRKVDHKLDVMISEGHMPYEQNAFAKYLAASLFESQNELNDALVDYRNTLKIRGAFPYLGQSLLRVTDKLRDFEDFDDFKKRFPNTGKYKMGKNEGEVVLLLEEGKSPIKVPAPQFRLVPVFRSRYYASDYVVLKDDGTGQSARTYTLYDIEATAIKELDNRLGGIIAKKVGGAVAKEAIAYGVAETTHSEALGLLTSIFLHATDKADLRSWSTLPAKLQLARLIVPAGRRQLSVDMVSKSGFETRGVKHWDTVDVKPGQITFLSLRTPE